MAMKTQMVSVVVPTSDRPALLREALQSIYFVDTSLILASTQPSE
jgi:hypothetical protein